MPPMLRAAINDLLAPETDVAIIGNSYDGEQSFAAASAERADILVTTQASYESDAFLAAFVEGQPRTVLLLRPERKTCVAMTLTSREFPLDGKSMTELVKAVRDATST